MRHFVREITVLRVYLFSHLYREIPEEDTLCSSAYIYLEYGDSAEWRACLLARDRSGSRIRFSAISIIDGLLIVPAASSFRCRSEMESRVLPPRKVNDRRRPECVLLRYKIAAATR